MRAKCQEGWRPEGRAQSRCAYLSLACCDRLICALANQPIIGPGVCQRVSGPVELGPAKTRFWGDTCARRLVSEIARSREHAFSSKGSHLGRCPRPRRASCVDCTKCWSCFSPRSSAARSLACSVSHLSVARVVDRRCASTILARRARLCAHRVVLRLWIFRRRPLLDGLR